MSRRPPTACASSSASACSAARRWRCWPASPRRGARWRRSRELTETARTIERTRDPSRRIPHPEAEDEVAELARTLDGMLHALDEARSETEATLARQREFVADASHELRTPLTSVLANLELLEEVLEGEQREAAASALRSSRRMRRLVADLLLLARADAGRITRHEPVDVAERGHRGGRRARAGVRRPRHHGLRPVGSDDLGRARRAPPPGAEPARERAAPHRPGHGGRGVGRARQRPGGLLGRGRRPGDPAGAARQGVRALLPRRRRPVGVLRPRARVSCARWRSRTTARSRSRTRWTAAAPASSCASRGRPRRSLDPPAGPAVPGVGPGARVTRSRCMLRRCPATRRTAPTRSPPDAPHRRPVHPFVAIAFNQRHRHRAETRALVDTGLMFYPG